MIGFWCCRFEMFKHYQKLFFGSYGRNEDQGLMVNSSETKETDRVSGTSKLRSVHFQY